MQFSNNEKIQKLLEKSKEITILGGIEGLLGWDQETYMPKKAGDVRAQQLALVAGIVHEKITSNENKVLIEEAESEIIKNPTIFSEIDKALVREFKRDYEKATKLPLEFVKELSELTSKALEAWKNAKDTNNFSIFQPYLEKIVEMKIKQAEFVGYKESPYDALLDDFEPGLTEKEVEEKLTPLRDFTINFLKKIQDSKLEIDNSILHRNYDTQAQLEFCERMSKEIGYDLEAGDLSLSSHPFTTEFATSTDVRITTRVDRNILSYSVMSTIHEAGHAMYEQGVDKILDTTHLGEGTSLGMHESQSRMWENIVGRSESFWKYWYPKLVQAFPEVLKDEEQHKLEVSLNRVSPSFIRTEADEVTYNLHIIIRFEIEKALIKREIKVADLPKVWDEKMQKYLGITPPTDTLGVLQDIHWSLGAIGYFPTYSLGNLYAAQFWNTIKNQVPNIEKDFESGNFETLLNWLRTNIHQYGRVYSAKEICERVTGEDLNSKYLMSYMEEKFGKIYK